MKYTGLKEGKKIVLENYKKAKESLRVKNGLYVQSGVEWENFCKAKEACMRYGVRI